MILPSTVDWCESNYLISNYIAEYWNTITGISLVLSSLFFYHENQTWFLNTKYYVNFMRIIGCFCLVGIGTILFHSTLFYPFQLLDELPMIFMANEYLLLLLSLQTCKKTLDKNTNENLERLLLSSYKMIKVIVLVYFIHPKLQIFTFHITLKIVEISILFVLYKLSYSLNSVVYSKIYQKQDFIKRQQTILKRRMMISSLYDINRRDNYLKDSVLLQIAQKKIKQYIYLRNEMKSHMYNGVYIYSASIFIWCLDNLFCKYIESLQLHAVWHVLSSLGIYFLNNILKIQAQIDEIVFDD